MAKFRAIFLTLLALSLLIDLTLPGQSFAEMTRSTPGKLEDKKLDPGVHQFTVSDIDGRSIDLNAYKGKVLLIVNTASQCGYTPQYKGLQRIYSDYKDKGFVILGFPSNDFGGQEPGSNKEIKEFCELKYKVTFPIFAKVAVVGPKQSPLFRYLTVDASKQQAGPIDWNFEKFLIDPHGKLIARFKSVVAPESPQLISQIESLLKTKK
jgi:glutathione peroxidase